MDQTLECCWGRRFANEVIGVDSCVSKQINVSSSGLRWAVFALVVNVPWTPYALALPFLSGSLMTPQVSAELGRPHKTVAHVTGQSSSGSAHLVRPGDPLVGHGAYAVMALGACVNAGR